MWGIYIYIQIFEEYILFQIFEIHTFFKYLRNIYFFQIFEEYIEYLIHGYAVILKKKKKKKKKKKTFEEYMFSQIFEEHINSFFNEQDTNWRYIFSNIWIIHSSVEII